MIAAIQQVGVTQEEAARLVGIGETTFYRWKARAREVAGLLPPDWKEHKKAELLDWCDDLGVDVAREVQGRGMGGRVLRVDLVAALQDQAGKYLDFFERLEMAYLEGELATAGAYRQIADGGRWVEDEDGRRWEPLAVRRTVVERDPKDQKTILSAKEIVTTVGPSEKALRTILERRYRRWIHKRSVDATVADADPGSTARSILEALQEIEETIPASPSGEEG